MIDRCERSITSLAKVVRMLSVRVCIVHLIKDPSVYKASGYGYSSKVHNLIHCLYDSSISRMGYQ